MWSGLRIGPWSSAAQQQADALALVAETPVLANPDAPAQSVLEDGARVSAEPNMWLASRRLACGASRVAMRHAVEPRIARSTAPPRFTKTATMWINDALGLNLHARTATPEWLGERLDVGWAIDVLHPSAKP